MKKRPPYNQNAAIRSALRRAFSRSPLVREVLNAVRREVPKYCKDGSLAKKPSVQYQCSMCNEWVGTTKVAVDHLNPVIRIDVGFEDWTVFIERLFCPKENLQCLCETCHLVKTNKERWERAYGQQLRELENFKPDADGLKWLKRFTPKRLSSFPYPQDFKDRIDCLKRSLGKKR